MDFKTNDFVNLRYQHTEYQGFITYVGKHGYTFTSCTPIAGFITPVFRNYIWLKHTKNPFNCLTYEEFEKHYPELLI